MSRKIALTLLFALTLVGCGDAAAGEGQVLWQSIVEHVLELVVLVATPLVLLLVRKLVRVLEDKTKINVAERHESMIDDWVSKGIAYAHEQGRKALKSGRKPPSGEKKKIEAVEFISEALKNTGVVSLGSDALAKLVEAKLNLEREPDDAEKPSS